MNTYPRSNDPDMVMLQRELDIAREEAQYFRSLAEEAGRRSIREIDNLTRLYREHRDTEKQLAERINMDTLLHDLAGSLMGLQDEEIGLGASYALQRLGEFLNVDRCSVYTYDKQDRRIQCECDWTRPGVLIDSRRVAALPDSLFDTLAAMFTGRDVVLIHPDTADIPPSVRDFFTQHGLSSIALIPMEIGEQSSGVLSVTIKTSPTHLPEVILPGLQTFAYLLANALERKRIGEERKSLEEQLRRRQRIDSLGSLAGGIAHDFGNLLIGIMGNIDLILVKSEGLAPHHRQHLETARKSCVRAASLVHDIRTFTCEESAERHADVHAIALEVFQALATGINPRIEHRIEAAAGACIVAASPGRLHQVFMNLATNAVHAIDARSPDAGGCITISAERHDASENNAQGLAPGSYIHIRFSDTGIGMTGAVIARAFDPLFTSGGIVHQGQGLGLPMVRAVVVEFLRGAIETESIPGAGTTFHIFLPEYPVIPAIDPIERTGDTGGRETLLVIDDECAVRDLLSESLGELGYTILTAGTGEEGLALLAEQRGIVDLVILDITLPGMSGVEVLRRLRKDYPDLHIMISSGTSEEDVETADGWLAKPFTLHDLITSVRATLDKPR